MSDEHDAPVIHSTAIVEDGASIGSGSRVWHHSHVRRGADVGAECTLGKNVFVDEGVVVGPRSKIQNNVSLYRGVTLESEVFVGPSAVFTNDLRPRAGSASWDVVATTVRQGASIGANATIVCGVELGAWCMVAAGSVVTRTVQPHQLVMGNPARPAGWVCSCGEILSHDPAPLADAVCPSCGAQHHGDKGNGK